MYCTIWSCTCCRYGGAIGAAPANPASVSTCDCTRPVRCSTALSQTLGGDARAGMKMTGRPVPMTFTVNAVGVNAGAGGCAGSCGAGVDAVAEHAATNKTMASCFTPALYHEANTPWNVI